MTIISDSKMIMLQHSKAKVELFKRYWSIYLSILNNVDFISKIYLFDTHAGEGIYENGGKGSPIVAIETIKNIYYQNNRAIKDIEILFNDNEKSDIEREILKIDRVKRFVNKIYKPQNVKIIYKSEEFSSIILEIQKKLDNISSSERALLFIDPWGYKEIRLYDLQRILANKKSELILFLPISFMYRFIGKAITDNKLNETLCPQLVKDAVEIVEAM